MARSLWDAAGAAASSLRRWRCSALAGPLPRHLPLCLPLGSRPTPWPGRSAASHAGATKIAIKADRAEKDSTEHYLQKIHPRRAYQCPTHANGHNMILRAKPMLRPNNWRTRVRKLTIESSMSRYIRSLKAAFAAQISIIADFGLSPRPNCCGAADQTMG